MPGPNSIEELGAQGGGRTGLSQLIANALGGRTSGQDFGQAIALSGGLGDPGDLANRAEAGQGIARRALGKEGFRLRDEEDKRREDALGILRGGLGQFDKSFADREQGLQGLQFGFAADQAGGQARQGISNLRGMLGSRGLGAGSGAAAGLASGVALRQQGSMIGAKRDIALGAAQRSAVHSAQRQQLIGGIGNLTNQGPSMLGLDTITNLLDQFSADRGMGAEEHAQRKANKAALQGAAIGGAFSIAGAGLGGA
jgi:hypothetical protein